MLFTMVTQIEFYKSEQVGSWKEWRKELRSTLNKSYGRRPFFEHLSLVFLPLSFFSRTNYKRQLWNFFFLSFFSIRSYKRNPWILPAETRWINGKFHQLWSGFGPPGTSLCDTPYTVLALSSPDCRKREIVERWWGNGKENFVLIVWSVCWWVAQLICLQLQRWRVHKMIVKTTSKGRL